MFLTPGDGDAGNGDDAAEHLTEILALVDRALELADGANEFVLGAKLSDASFCARMRRASLTGER